MLCAGKKAQERSNAFHTISSAPCCFPGNICGGCTVQDTYTGELLRFVCDAVLIATGGLHGLFGDTTGSLANTGEVTAELFRLGVPMANLEMIQYHPTTVELGENGCF